MFKFVNSVLRRHKKVEPMETGLLPSPIDSRDFLLSGQTYLPDNVPDELPPLFQLEPSNQGQSPSCFPGGTMILTEDMSYRPIREIRVGDIVYTHTGQKKEVTEIFRREWQGTMKRMKIWGDYREIVATQEHPIYAIKEPPVRRLSNKWITTRDIVQLESAFYPICELKKGDYVGLPLSGYCSDKTIYAFERDPEFLWVLGLYLAGGSTKSERGEITFSLHERETAFYERAKNAMARYGVMANCYFKPEAKGLAATISSKRWTKIFEELGGKLCQHKRINKRLMSLDPSLQMKIIEGLMDGDGHIRRKGHKILVTTSETLAIQVRTILLRNGIYSSLTKRKPREDRKDAWCVEYYEKNRLGFIKDGMYFAKIKEMEHIPAFYGENVYNLEVEDDHSYLVNGIAVHNCVGHSCAHIKQEKELRERITQKFDGEWIYARCKELDGFPNLRGTFFRIGLKVLQKQGALPLGGGEPERFKIGSYAKVDDTSFEGLKKALCVNGYLSSGYRLSRNGWRTAYVRPPKPGEKTSGHAIALVGYTKNHLIGLNSWGDGWGDNGYFYIPKDYRPIEAWAILTDLPTPPEKGGWVAEKFLSNDVVSPAAGLRVREGAGLKYQIIKVLPQGTKVERLDGRTYADGYWWVRIRA